jgi:hypothetical protein
MNWRRHCDRYGVASAVALLWLGSWSRSNPTCGIPSMRFRNGRPVFLSPLFPIPFSFPLASHRGLIPATASSAALKRGPKSLLIFRDILCGPRSAFHVAVDRHSNPHPVLGGPPLRCISTPGPSNPQFIFKPLHDFLKSRPHDTSMPFAEFSVDLLAEIQRFPMLQI